MDTATHRIILRWLTALPGDIRIPTACWLFSDLMNILDSTVRFALTDLETAGKISIDNGGWIHVR